MKRCEVMEMIKNLLLAGLLVILGILMFVLQSSINDILYFSSFALLAIAVYMIVHYCVNAKELPNAEALFLAAILLAAGSTMLIVWEMVIYFMGVALAAVGGYLLARALEAKKAGKLCVKDLVSGIIHLVFGLSYFVLIWLVSDAYIVIPVMFIISGVYQCVAMFAFKKRAKKAE